MRSSFVNVLLNQVKKDEKTILLTGDLGFGVLKELQEKYPSHYLNCGIAEANMITFAGGMSTLGYMPIVYSIGNFPTLRAIEQVRNDICYPNNNVKIICIGGGYTYGSLGMSHHALEDIGMLKTLPNIHILTPSTKQESKVLSEYMFSTKGPCYLRLERDSDPKLISDIDNITLGEPCKVINDNNKTAIFTYGTLLGECIKINGVDIYSNPVLKPINEDKYAEVISKYNKIIVVEEHNVIGGFGETLASIIARKELSTKISLLGVPDCYLHVVGEQDLLRRHAHISKEDIEKEVIR